MEAGNHFKNGASPKSQMSRRKLFQSSGLLVFLFFVMPLAVVGQGQGNDVVFHFGNEKNAETYGKKISEELGILNSVILIEKQGYDYWGVVLVPKMQGGMPVLRDDFSTITEAQSYSEELRKSGIPHVIVEKDGKIIVILGMQEPTRKGKYYVGVGSHLSLESAAAQGEELKTRYGYDYEIIQAFALGHIRYRVSIFSSDNMREANNRVNQWKQKHNNNVQRYKRE